MAESPIAADIPQPCNVLQNLAPQFAFNDVVLLDDAGDPADFVFRKLTGLDINADACVFQNVFRSRSADPIYVGKGISIFLSLGISTPTSLGIKALLLFNPAAACGGDWYKLRVQRLCALQSYSSHRFFAPKL